LDNLVAIVAQAIVDDGRTNRYWSRWRVLGGGRPAAPDCSAVLSSAIVLKLMVVVYMNLTQSQPQGRHLLPTLSRHCSSADLDWDPGVPGQSFG